MTDYIKREDAVGIVKNLKRFSCFGDDGFVEIPMVYCELMQVASADVAPVRHGHWIKHEGRNGAKDSIECSACGVWIDDMPRKTFCPNCGSIMYRYGGNNG